MINILFVLIVLIGPNRLIGLIGPILSRGIIFNTRAMGGVAWVVVAWRERVLFLIPVLWGGAVVVSAVSAVSAVSQKKIGAPEKEAPKKNRIILY